LSTEPAGNAGPDWPEGTARIVLDSTDSTLSEAARRFADLTGPAWIMAQTQTAARGRRGRVWRSPPGNFAASFVMQLDLPPEQAVQRSFVMALALHDAVAGLTGRSEALALKWPNDVLLNGGKLAGILLESLNSGGRIAGLAIGVGVNLADAPTLDQVEPGAVRPVSLAAETGLSVASEAFLDRLAAAYAARDDSFRRFGFAPTRQAWLARAARLGEVVTARLPREEITGTFETLDTDGYLVMRTPQGLRHIAAADVVY